jgi:hypothetical protein
MVTKLNGKSKGSMHIAGITNRFNIVAFLTL